MAWPAPEGLGLVRRLPHVVLVAHNGADPTNAPITPDRVALTPKFIFELIVDRDLAHLVPENPR